MSKTTHIGWTDHTANFWWGCQRVSPGCEHCYAEELATTRRKLKVWGPPKTTERLRMKGVWSDVPKWNREAIRDGVRRRMFVSSMADVFEDHPQVAPWRSEALALLETCTSLDVQLLTKRPENIRGMVPAHWLESWPAHVWVGTTVEDQKRAEERIPHLLRVPARVRFLSCEPLLEAIDIESHLNVRDVDWVIVGGESGSDARPFDIAWARSIISQCRDASVPVFMKQLGARPVDSARAEVHQPCVVDGRRMLRSTIYSTDAPEVAQARVDARDERLVFARPQVSHPYHVRVGDRAGADPSQWLSELRVQEFPR